MGFLKIAQLPKHWFNGNIPGLANINLEVLRKRSFCSCRCSRTAMTTSEWRRAVSTPTQPRSRSFSGPSELTIRLLTALVCPLSIALAWPRLRPLMKLTPRPTESLLTWS